MVLPRFEATMYSLNPKDLHRIFEKLDKNGDGLVSLGELNWLLERIGVHTSLDELESLAGKTSLDCIDFLLFYESFIRESKVDDDEEEEERMSSSLESDLDKAFKVFDLNNDGFISWEELQSVLSKLGLGGGLDCKSMIRVYDTNSDGLLDFEEFKKMMLHTTS